MSMVLILSGDRGLGKVLLKVVALVFDLIVASHQLELTNTLIKVTVLLLQAHFTITLLLVAQFLLLTSMSLILKNIQHSGDVNILLTQDLHNSHLLV
jgi:hypothetical protein